ncbi:MAG: hypothetical protein ETSY2_50130 [Candidatus Entotheonella gemina]|uniref:Helix-turn-helix domain-containing protein n=1 Tax=Candidatus Entotheonella gemina TaxID=1429439 RepID=W4L946_9BACT|nr:MAG: hypothetical protein ETSY2_50130 [Candidatus Entotheonella gemina]
MGQHMVGGSDILTLDELADYLRLPPEVIERQVKQGLLPGRCIESIWRFRKAAIDQWLQRQDSRTVLLHQVGAFLDDDSLPALRAAIYADRGRPETEDTETS